MIGVEILIKTKYGFDLGTYQSTTSDKKIVATDLVTSRWNAPAQLQEDLVDPEVVYRDLVFSTEVHRRCVMPLSEFIKHFKKY